MARTLTTSGFNRFVPSTKAALCCLVLLFLFRFHGTQAASGNSSGVVSTDDGTGGDDDSTVTKGMRPFYSMVRSFLLVVQPNKIAEEPWLNLSDLVRHGEFNTDEINDWKNWADYLVGYMVCVAVGIVFFIVMPITGLIFCCCRCAGKCGGRAKPHDPKRAGCKRKTYCTLLLVLNTVALAGVICAFMSNQILYEKMSNENNAGPVGKLISTADEINGFVNTTVDDVETSVLGAFERAQVGILQDIRASADKAVDDVLKTINATSLLDQIKAIGSDVDSTQQALSDVTSHLNTLVTMGSWLSDNLTVIRANLSAACGSGCGSFDPDQLSMSANFSGLSDFSKEIGDVNKAANLSQQVTDAENDISTIKTNASQTVNRSIADATGSVNTVHREIQKAVNKVRSDLQSGVTKEIDRFRSNLQDNQPDITKYSKYVWYAGLAISCVLLLVVVLYYVGVLFGLCGERPGQGAQCCNTGAGANFLMAGVGVTFLLTWLIMLVCTLLFVGGGVLYTELCQYFHDHNPKELQPFSDSFIQAADFSKSLFNDSEVNLDLVTILEDCQNDSAIYSAMQLDNMVNISQYTDLSNFYTSMDDLESSGFNIPNITIWTQQMNQSIYDFANSKVDNSTFATYDREINKNLTVVELPVLASQLRGIAQGLPNGDILNERADELDILERDIIVPMKQTRSDLSRSLVVLRNAQQADVESRAEQLSDGLRTAEDNFNSQKDTLVSSQLTGVVNEVKHKADEAVQGILTDVQQKIGKCRPVFNSFYTASDAVCVVALDPLNGFWFGIGWCLFFFVPCLIFAVKLAGLYRREHEEDDFEDRNFELHDGHKQDTFPLTSADQGRRQAHPGRDGGMANSAFVGDSPSGRKGGGYERDFPAYYDKHGPPPYGYQMGSGNMNGSRGGMDHRQGRMYPY